MKKKLFSLVLILMLLPTIFMFTGCNSKGYKLSSLTEDYTKIYTYSTIKIEENQFKIDYSAYEKLNTQIASAPYSYISNYNTMLKNMMSFADNYLSIISSGSFNVKESVRNRLQSQLKDLDKALNKVDVKAQNCASRLVLSGDPNDALCLNSLRDLLNSYSEAFQSAFNFNSTLMEIYFSNTKIQDYSEVENFEALRAIVDVKLEARIIQQVVYTTAYFVEVEFDSSDFIQSLTTSNNFGGKADIYASYVNTISSINKTFTDENIDIVNVNADKTAEFKDLAIKLNNLQAIINSEVKYYRSAVNSINYIKISADKNATNEELAEITQINNFKYITNQYNNVLIDMLSVLGV